MQLKDGIYASYVGNIALCVLSLLKDEKQKERFLKVFCLLLPFTSFFPPACARVQVFNGTEEEEKEAEKSSSKSPPPVESTIQLQVGGGKEERKEEEQGVELVLRKEKEKERPKTKEQGTQTYFDAPGGKSVLVTSLGIINDDEEAAGIHREQSTEL